MQVKWRTSPSTIRCTNVSNRVTREVHDSFPNTSEVLRYISHPYHFQHIPPINGQNGIAYSDEGTADGFAHSVSVSEFTQSRQCGSSTAAEEQPDPI